MITLNELLQVFLGIVISVPIIAGGFLSIFNNLSDKN